MGLETANDISELVPANPAGSDETAQGDDHIRLIKAVLQATFPNISGALTASHTALNTLAADVGNFIKRDGSVSMTGPLQMGGQRVTGAGAATNATDLVTKAQLDAVASGATSGASAALSGAWPIGSVYTSVVSTNPATLFGFGTWTRYAQGRMLISEGTGNDGQENRNFGGGSTGGNYEVELSNTNLPSHNHGIFAADANPVSPGLLTSRTQTVQVAGGTQTGDNNQQYAATRAGSITPSSPAFFGSTQNTGNTGATARHENMPPYITVYMWRRTA